MKKVKDMAFFTGNTKIPLLNGESLTLKEWYETKKDLGFYVYVYDKRNGKISYSTMHGIDRIKAEGSFNVIKYQFDNGMNEDILSKPFGPSIIMNGNYITSLARRISSKNDKDELEGYEMINEGNEWIYTHRLVAQNNDLSKVVHHKDKDKRNNFPTNLEIIGKKNHAKMHESENVDRAGTRDMFEGMRIERRDRKMAKMNEKTKISVMSIYQYESDYKFDIYSFMVTGHNSVALESGIFVEI